MPEASQGGRAGWGIPLMIGKAALAGDGGNVVNRLTGQWGALMTNGGGIDRKNTRGAAENSGGRQGMANIWRAWAPRDELVNSNQRGCEYLARVGAAVNLARNEAFLDGATTRRLQPNLLEDNPGTDALEEGGEVVKRGR